MTPAVHQVLTNLGALDAEDQKYVDALCVGRYLQAVNGDVKKATEQLKGTLEWRKKFKPDQVLTNDLEAVILREKHYLAGCCKNGHAVMITRKRVRRLETDEEEVYIRYLIYTAEKAISMMGQTQDRWVWILDLKGYSSSNSPRFALTMKIIKILANHYPERLKKAYLVDAPTVFSVMYKMVYPFLDQPTKDKTCFVYSSDYNQTGELLSGLPDGTNFTQYYGFYSKEHDPVMYTKKIKEAEENPDIVF